MAEHERPTIQLADASGPHPLADESNYEFLQKLFDAKEKDPLAKAGYDVDAVFQILEGKKAVGVRYKKNNKSIDITCNKEVILSSGAFGSPQILMLSGVGSSEHLTDKAITPVHDLPGVGQNLQDHIDYIQAFKIDGKHDTFGYSVKGSFRILKSMFKWHKHRTGKVTSTFAESGAFFSTQAN